MKPRKYLIIAAFTLLCILPLSDVGDAEEIKSEDGGMFIFPSSLERIEDEAFEGTAVETAVFPEGFVSIGERAFDNACALKDVYIPDTTTYIADSAFSAAADLTIYGLDDSYAEDWAKKHDVLFVAKNVWNLTALYGRSRSNQIISLDRFFAAIVL